MNRVYAVLILLFFVGLGFSIKKSIEKTAHKDFQKVVILRSIPQEASILIAGQLIGKTPLPVNLPKVGKIKVTLSKEGFQEYGLSLDETSSHGPITVKLEPK